MVENVIQIKSRITINVDASVKKVKKGYATCSCEKWQIFSKSYWQ